MLTDYTLTDANIGDVLPVTNGYLVNLKRTQSGPYEMPQWSEGLQRWRAGRFVLRGSRDYRDLICIDTGSDGGWGSQWGRASGVLINASVPYLGDLMIVCIPRGSVWELSISDVPYIPPPPTWPPTFPREDLERIAALRAKIAGEREPALIRR